MIGGMVELIWRVLPIALSVVASPVAVLALLGIMLSDNARRNAAAYSAGWILAVSALLAMSLWALVALEASPGDEAPIIRALHVIIALLCFGGAAFVYRRARGTLERLSRARTPDEIVAATPSCPASSAPPSRPRSDARSCWAPACSR